MVEKGSVANAHVILHIISSLIVSYAIPAGCLIRLWLQIVESKFHVDALLKTWQGLGLEQPMSERTVKDLIIGILILIIGILIDT